jgi:indole-3-glycerol phosphate synthase
LTSYSSVSSDFLKMLCEQAMARVRRGYYDVKGQAAMQKKTSLVDAIMSCSGNAVISELKRSSPSAGPLVRGLEARRAVKEMEQGGAVGISVLTASDWFNGSLNDFEEARQSTLLPLLMKDIIVSRRQIEAAAKLGANAILLIYRAFKRGYTEMGLEEAIKEAHDQGLEVLLESCCRDELEECLELEADMFGVNCRDLSTLVVNKSVHEEAVKGLELGNRVFVAESGIEGAEDIRRLRRVGYKAFLIGTSIMRSGDIQSKVGELVKA